VVETHRLFFALWPNDATRDALAATAQAVRQRQHPAGRWNRPSRFHVTLQFLGGYPVWPDDIVARATSRPSRSR
jgi:RNA 2',3'-cyclic 3'-phosphodiesterase